jgi:hypothetical protein
MARGNALLKRLASVKSKPKPAKRAKSKTKSKSRRKSAGEKKTFVLLKGNADTNVVFRNKQPRGAALKAASRGHKKIRLRERGTNRVHVFTGTRTKVAKQESFKCKGGGGRWALSQQSLCEEWTPKWKSNVRKIRIEHR